MSLTGYTKILHLNHKRGQDLWKAVSVWVEEKIDGSQFAFGVIEGELVYRSKRAEVFDGSAGMFQATIDGIKAAHERSPLKEGWIYRGEAMRGPKHNVLTYGRAPVGNIVIWDVETGPGNFLSPSDRAVECCRIGLECVSVLRFPPLSSISKGDCETLLRTESQLGGVPIEGFVVKQHEVFDRMGHLMLYKFVSEAFKEKHKKADNPGGYAAKANVIQTLQETYAAPARWAKARQRLREEGACTETPKDIGKLIAYAKEDLGTEEAQAIKDALFTAFSKEILAGACRGLPEGYKLELAHNPNPTPESRV